MEPKGDAAPLFQHIDVHESNKVPGPSAHLKLATPLQVKLAGSNLKVRLSCNPPMPGPYHAGRLGVQAPCNSGMPTREDTPSTMLEMCDGLIDHLMVLDALWHPACASEQVCQACSNSEAWLGRGSNAPLQASLMCTIMCVIKNPDQPNPKPVARWTPLMTWTSWWPALWSPT